MSLKKNFSWTFLSNIIYAVSQWGMLIFIAKLGSPEMVGVFSLALAVTAPIMMLFNLNLRSVQATDQKDSSDFYSYFCLRIITTLMALIIIFTITFMFGYTKEQGYLILIIGLSKGIESISDVIFGVFQRNERMDLISISRILKGVFSLFVLGGLLFFTKSIIIASAGMALSWLLVLILYDFKHLRSYQYTKKTKFNLMISIIKISFPLGIVMMINSFNTNIPRYFLEDYGIKYLGYYVSMAYIITAGNTIVTALGQSATPRLAKYYAKHDIGAFKDLLKKLSLIGLLIGLIGVVVSFFFGKELLALIYTPDYANYSYEFVLIMLAGLFTYMSSFQGYGLTAARIFKLQPIIGVIWMIVGLITSFALIPTYGLKGAAYSLIISSITKLLCQSIVLKFSYNKQFLNNKKDLH